MRFLFFIAFLVIGIADSLANQDELYDYNRIYTSDVNHNDGIDYDSLVHKINATGAQSLEDVLQLVPKEFYDNYVLVYRSRSLQDASPLYPRAVVFGRSAKFIMAFNGHEKQKGYNNLEIIQFREKEFRWEFREITFIDGKTPVVSEPNPKKCLECHQSPKRVGIDPRPNWEPYNFWPGVYASVDSKIHPVLKQEYDQYISGKIINVLNEVLLRFLPQDMLLIEEQSHEKENLDSFFRNVYPTHGRYRHLGRFSVRSPLNFTKSTTILNMRRVARILKAELGDLFNIYKFALLGLGDAATMTNSKMLKYRCHDLYMPPTVHQKHLSYTLTKRSLVSSHYKKPEKAMRFEHALGAGFDITLMPLGILTDDLSMDFKTDGRFSIEDRFTSPHSSATHFRDAAMLVYADDPAIEMDCKQLRAASNDVLTEFEKNGDLEKALLQTEAQSPPMRSLIQRCISCHVNYEDRGQAPHIPFDNYSKLRPLLKQAGYKRGTLFEEIVYRTGDHAPLKEQMPPAGFVDRSQRDSLIRELEKLIN